MALTGRIQFGTTGDINQRVHNGTVLLIGQDTNHYVTLAANSGNYASVGHVESESVIDTTNATAWRTDLASLGLGGHTGETYSPKHYIPLPGTDDFYIIGGGHIGQANRRHVVGVLYSIVNNTTVNVTGGFLYNGTTNNTNTLEQGGVVGYVHGQIVIGSDLYFVLTCGFITTKLCKVPTSGTNNDASVGSWDARCFTLPWSYGLWHETTTRRYWNMGSLRDAGSGKIGVMVYLSQQEINSGVGVHSGLSPLPTASVVIYTEVTPGVGNSGVSDLTSLFGVPFSDEGLNYAGAPGTQRDNYTSPSVIYGSNELIFCRTFSDARSTGRFRRFIMTNISTVIVGAVSEAIFTVQGGWILGTMERAMVFKESNEYHFATMDWDFVYFGLESSVSSGAGKSYNRIFGC